MALKAKLGGGGGGGSDDIHYQLSSCLKIVRPN